jgi:hypothetical protein
VLAGGALAEAPAKKGAAAAAKDPPPIADYWMDVATTSGMGAGMTPGGRPDMGQIMSMMNGGGGSVGHTLDLRLASRDKPAAAPLANHLIPPALQMGPSLPLITPVRAETPRTQPGMPTNFQQPKGRMLIYWGCGEHVGPGQPTVIDFAKVAAGQMPPGMASFANMAHVVSGPHSAPPIAFSLAAGQDFMPGLGLTEAGATPAGATPLRWTPAAAATGYALAMFGASGNGDVVMWSSASKAMMPALDYLSPAEVKKQIAAGAVLGPATSQCLLPAEVGAAVPMGMVTMIGYGPEAYFAEKPKAPKWTTRVRFKTTASVMHGMAGMMGGGMMGAPGAQAQGQQPQAQPPKKKKRGLLGDIIEGATGIPVPH